MPKSLQDPPWKPVFDEMIFNKRKRTRPKPHFDRINRGWDTETKNGSAFILGVDDDWWPVDGLEEILKLLTNHKYRSVRNCWWNIDYDVTAIMKHDYDAMMDLLLNGRTEYEGYRLDYLRRKLLKIRTPDKRVYYHYDVAQFYMSPLAIAAQKYLGEEPPDMKYHRHELEKFPIEQIGAYCEWDANATKRLTDLYTSRLAEIELAPKHLISNGNLAQQLQLIHADVPTWRNQPTIANRLAWLSQRGAWIDVWKRGTTDVWKYDINSAYPAMMVNYPDTRDGYWIHEENPTDAAFGFCRAVVQYDSDTPPVLATHVDPSNLYVDLDEPRTCILTIQEYRYLKRKAKRVDADLWYSFIPNDNPRYPWRDLLLKLQTLKKESKWDPAKYLAVKALINSFFGKTTEKIERDGQWHAGVLFNPVASATTLACPRIQVAEAIEDQLDDVVAIATDSVALTRPLRGLDIGEELGQWDVEAEGKRGTFLQPGVYQVDGKEANTRGFKRTGIKGIDEIVQKNSDTFTIKMDRPYSGRQASRWGKPQLANIFEEHEYKINVRNVRRLWNKEVRWFSDLRDDLIESVPIPVGLAEAV